MNEKCQLHLQIAAHLRWKINVIISVKEICRCCSVFLHLVTEQTIYLGSYDLLWLGFSQCRTSYKVFLLPSEWKIEVLNFKTHWIEGLLYSHGTAYHITFPNNNYFPRYNGQLILRNITILNQRTTNPRSTGVRRPIPEGNHSLQPVSTIWMSETLR
jgi:hypothetical protein